MFILPWVDGDWQYVQGVWDRWQGLNVGMLAFISSLVAFNISSYNANNQRKREFQAAKAFLPAALSELCSYFKSSAQVFISGWESNQANMPELSAPNLPEGYKQIFSECIKHAAPEVGDYLSKILSGLQVHDSRMKEFVHQFSNRNCDDLDRHNLISYFYSLAELQALVNQLFDFARGEANFDVSSLKWEEFACALRNMEISYEDISIDENMALEPFIKRTLKRQEKL
jgi:hypothetical protein